MSLRDELQARADKLDAELLALSGRIRAIERESDDVHTCINALDIAEMDAQDAALEPAPEYDPSSLAHEEELAPALADPPSAELRSVPGAEDEVRDHIPTVRADWDDEPDEVWTQEQLDQIDTDAQAFVEAIGAPQVSIVDDPELQAAVSRAEATLAAAEPAYVGLQDPELDADWDAMKERQEAGRKLHFSIFGKREEV